MSDLEFLTDGAVRKWAAEQEKYAQAIAKEDPRRAFSILMLEHTSAIRIKLARPGPGAEQRRHTIVARKLTQWEKENPYKKPPLRKLNAEAYSESQPELMALVREIADLREQAAALPIQSRRSKRLK